MWNCVILPTTIDARQIRAFRIPIIKYELISCLCLKETYTDMSYNVGILVIHPEEGTNISPETLVYYQEGHRVITLKILYIITTVKAFNYTLPTWLFDLVCLGVTSQFQQQLRWQYKVSKKPVHSHWWYVLQQANATELRHLHILATRQRLKADFKTCVLNTNFEYVLQNPAFEK